jgi:hypothetical protein
MTRDHKDYLSYRQLAKPSRDSDHAVRHDFSMPPRRSAAAPALVRTAKRDTTPREYKLAYIARIKAAREAMPAPPGKKKFTQGDMAAALGLEQDHYKQFERRSMLPPHLLVEFCRITDQHPWYMLTGQSGTKSPGLSTRPSAELRQIPSGKPTRRPR